MLEILDHRDLKLISLRFYCALPFIGGRESGEVSKIGTHFSRFMRVVCTYIRIGM